MARAWEKAGAARAYLPRKNGLGEPLPTFCLKIPTGGGKTLLATKVIDLVNTHYRRRQAGLVLWIVPTTQNLQPDVEGAEGPRPSLPAAARCLFGGQNADIGEEHRLQAARCARAPVRSAAHAAIRQP